MSTEKIEITFEFPSEETRDVFMGNFTDGGCEYHAFERFEEEGYSMENDRKDYRVIYRHQIEGTAAEHEERARNRRAEIDKDYDAGRR